jgi:predicted nucleotidyltransferase
MNSSLELLQSEVLEILKNEPVTIFLFGSRARGENATNADVDIGLMSQQPLDFRLKAKLIDRIENLNIPFKVDLVDFAEVSESFKQEALKKIIIWKD